ncbi:glycosyltransferase family 39 protein [Paludisphaera sp.]|uniref:ArnT family glycosyltransferase n=1 Tax=Paludisphaera sp. TaxID=2017432 RepID=UPI00301BF730
MTPAEPSCGTPPRREWAFVAAMTAVGLAVRIWGLGRLGLVHFDEGIYAIAGLWPFGAGGIDPLVIPYAPAGFPAMVGLSYLILGPSDAAAILVSIAAGTLAIPASAWLARRTFGPDAGAVAAALAALSAFHVAFSRMALTDASATLAWLLGLIAAQRFLERPGPGSALTLGLATGLAQLVKYSGWTVGAAAALGAVAIVAFDPDRRTKGQARSYLAWGIAAAVVAAVVYAPWVAFVERHGSYAALLAHHRGYMGTAATWPSHWLQQLRQSAALSGGFPWNAKAWGLAAIGVAIAGGQGRRRRASLVFAVGIAATIAPSALWWIGLATLVFAPGASPAVLLLGAAWVGMSLLTPFYHPYARLWLPTHALGWIAAAGLVGGAGGAAIGRAWPRFAVLAACCVAAIAQTLAWPSASLPGPLSPSDSLRTAVAKAREEGSLADRPLVRVLARPPARFYLAGVATRVEPDAEALLRGGGDAWALVDMAQLRQSGDASDLAARLLERWEKVAEFPTTLNPPTLLDVDPGAAVVSRQGEADAPLWLLRPRPGAP